MTGTGTALSGAQRAFLQGLDTAPRGRRMHKDAGRPNWRLPYRLHQMGLIEMREPDEWPDHRSYRITRAGRLALSNGGPND